MSGIIFPDINTLCNEVTIDNTAFPMIVLADCKAFSKAEMIHKYIYIIQLLMSPWEACQ